jgi:hypothetical protein
MKPHRHYRRNIGEAFEADIFFTEDSAKKELAKKKARMLRRKSWPVVEITLSIRSIYPKITHKQTAFWVKDISINTKLEKAWELKFLLEIASMEDVSRETKLNKKEIHTYLRMLDA